MERLWMEREVRQAQWDGLGIQVGRAAVEDGGRERASDAASRFEFNLGRGMDGRREDEGAWEEEEWELVSSPQEGDNDCAGSEDPGLLGHATEWLQWGLEGAVKGVETTYEGLSGIVRYNRIQKERREALSLASKQQWQLMRLQHDRLQEKRHMEEAARERDRLLSQHLHRLQQMKRERDRALADIERAREALDNETEKVNEKQDEMRAMQLRAEKMALQEKEALSALDALRDRHMQLQEEGHSREKVLEEKESLLRRQHDSQRLQIAALREELKVLEQERDALQANRDEELPDEFYCPITMEVMLDPVLAADGFSYERKAIQDWLNSGKLTSPKTGIVLESKELHVNLSLRSLIQDRTRTRLSSAVHDPVNG